MSLDAMTSGWYYAKAGAPAGHEIGPLSWQELYLLAQGGSLTPSDLVWNPKLPRGVTAGHVPGLFPSLVVPEAPEEETTAPPPARPTPIELPATTTPQGASPKASPVETPLASAQPVAPPADSVSEEFAGQQPSEPIPESPPPTSAPPAKDKTSAVATGAVAVDGPEAPSAQRVEPLSDAKAAEDKPVKDKPGPSPKKRGHTNLPWLIVLLAAAIAAAGLAAYFIYLRDLWF